MKPRVLIAEDDPDIRAFMSEILQDEGFEAVAVAGGRDAIAALDAGWDADFVISDFLMPAGDGRELLVHVRRRDARRPLFIMMTGQSDVSGDDILRLGAQEFLVKPFAMERLLLILRGYLPEASRSRSTSS